MAPLRIALLVQGFEIVWKWVILPKFIQFIFEHVDTFSISNVLWEFVPGLDAAVVEGIVLRTSITSFGEVTMELEVVSS